VITDTDVRVMLAQDPQAIGKYQITRTILTRLNQQRDAYLGPRREVVKRVVEFEDFSTCWPQDQLMAKGLVAEIRRVVNVKDSFTRMQHERETERQRHVTQRQAEAAAIQQRRKQLEDIRRDLARLFTEPNPHRRGKLFESVLNSLFAVEGILVREAFTLVGDQGEGVIEQIDGAIELDGNVYLVEAKWWNQPLGAGATAQHLVRVYSRGDVRGLFISASGYSEPAITAHRQALVQKVVVLCDLRELVLLLEQDGDLKDLLRKKERMAVLERNPLHQPLAST
jgi:restriction system protein